MDALRIIDLLSRRDDTAHLEKLIGRWCFAGSIPLADGAGGWSYRTSVQVVAGPLTRIDLSDELFPLRKRGDGRAFANTLLVGRAASNDVIISHDTVSKLHARVEIVDGDAAAGIKVRDAGSSNGTRINGADVVDAVGSFVGDGGAVAFGSCAFVVLSLSRLQSILSKVRL